jgi:hypothetical protein
MKGAAALFVTWIVGLPADSTI